MAKQTITLTLSGPCAQHMVRSLALNYAMLDLRSALTTPDYANAPWHRIGSPSTTDLHKRWLRRVAAGRNSYRDALARLLGSAPPDVPQIDYKPWTPPRAKVPLTGCYSSEKVGTIARAYADDILGRLDLK